jgi:F-type H+-transporting ATPase subunit epsilon
MRSVKKMQFSLLTPEGELFSTEVEEVIAQGSEGEMGILADHIPLVTSLQIAPLVIKANGKESSFAVYGGMLQVTAEKVTILADDAQLPEDIDRQTAQARQNELQNEISRASDNEQRDQLQAELETVEVQLEVTS